MRSSYKRLGPYIRPVDVRNKKLEVDLLLGVSIQKILMQSIANTVGTDMSKYKIIRNKQFAYGPVTSRNGDKISVALLEDHDAAILSQAYIVFEVIDHNELDPEYLMMWFRRPEFDRYARFKSHGSARETFDWEEMREVELPVPSIEKQREIVKEYKAVVNRIKLNEQLNQKLEETAQALYKHWFVDFEFPDENGKPYKSSGGKMVWNEELGKDVPEGWEYLAIQTLIDRKLIFKNQDGNHGEVHPKSSDFVEIGVPFIMAKDLEYGTLELDKCKFISKEKSEKLRIDPAISGDVLLTHKATMGRVAIVPEELDHVVLTPQVTYYRVQDESRINKEFIYCLFISDDFQRRLLGDSEQSTRNFLSITNQRLMKILLPDDTIIREFKSLVGPLLRQKSLCYQQRRFGLSLIKILEAKMTQVEVEKKEVVSG